MISLRVLLGNVQLREVVVALLCWEVVVGYGCEALEKESLRSTNLMVCAAVDIAIALSRRLSIAIVACAKFATAC